MQPWEGAAVKDETDVDLAVDNAASLITCQNSGTILEILRRKEYRQDMVKN